MDKLDWKKLLTDVDEGYRTWRNDSVILYGNKVRTAVACFCVADFLNAMQDLF